MFGNMGITSSKTDSSKFKFTSPVSGIGVDARYENPDAIYASMKWSHIKRRPIPRLDTPIKPDKLRIVCISDTHSNTGKLKVPDGDVLLHGGDFTTRGLIAEVIEFNDFLGSLPHRHKVVIAGNHELSFGYADKNAGEHRLVRGFGFRGSAAVQEQLTNAKVEHPRDLLTNCTYLQESEVTIAGLKFYGSPWSAWFHGWAYNVKRGVESLKLYDRIPVDTDVLMTHGPPLGIGDRCHSGNRAGCAELLSTVTKRVKPKLHIFGHIHEDPGLFTDGVTLFANASTLDKCYQVANEPILIDLDIPDGFSKEDISEITFPVDPYEKLKSAGEVEGQTQA